MQTTKAKILSLLKRRGRLAVDALSDELGLAPMTVRQHLTSLERDRLVEAVPERQAKGRPHYIYGLTAQGEESFPKRYDWLAAQVLNEVGEMDPAELAGLSPAQRTEHILGRIANRLASPHISRLRSLQLDERIREVVPILQNESGFVECGESPDSYEIVDYNCMYRAITGEMSGLCAWHRRVIVQLLGVPPSDLDGDGEGFRCRYVVAKTSKAEAPDERSGSLAGRFQVLNSQEVLR